MVHLERWDEAILAKARAPIYEALLRYRSENNILLHMPGHLGGKGFTAPELAAAGSLDFTEAPGLDDLHCPSGPLQEARELLAAAFGARESYFLVNGATSGIQALFLATCQENKPVLVPRNAHRSFWAGLLLSGAIPVYYECRQEETGLVTGPEPGAIESALMKVPGATAVFMVSPNYYGLALDVNEAVRCARIYDKMVLVDEAHGAHFGFHPRLPSPALAQGSAAVVHGMHKVLPVMTQGAALHTGAGFSRGEILRRSVDMLTTTSPSYPILASLDIARCLMVERGEELLDKALGLADEFRGRIRSLKGLYCPGNEVQGFPGVAGYDPLKVFIGVERLPLTGYQVAALLRERFKIQVEMAQRDGILAMFSLFHGRDDWSRFYSALKAISEEYPSQNKPVRPRVPLPPSPEVVLTPRQAHFSPHERVKLTEAAGEIAAEMVAGYPPGIPCLVPGERLTPEALDYLLFLRSSGAGIHGPEDPGLEYLNIVRA